MSDLDAARLEAEKGRKRLQQAIIDLCPGPHAVVQHRDMRPPWCPVCRRTADGLAVP